MWADNVRIQSWYCCLSLAVVGVDEVILGFLLQGLEQGDSAGCVYLDGEQSCEHPVNAEALRGDGAGAFSIYAVHTCHLWEGLKLGKCDLCLPVLCLWRLVRCVVLLTVQSGVVSCTGGGMIWLTCLFHSSQLDWVWFLCPHESEKHVDGVAHTIKKHLRTLLTMESDPGDLLFYNLHKHSLNPLLSRTESWSHVRLFGPWFSALVTGVSSLKLS
jgi:hypothetical protein